MIYMVTYMATYLVTYVEMIGSITDPADFMPNPSSIWGRSSRA